MICKDCQRCARSALRRPRFFTSAPELERLRDVICSRCGRVLPPPGPSETMLEKLMQLARFGLTEGGTPLLELSGGRGRTGRRDF